jgi:hypothetical protein
VIWLDISADESAEAFVLLRSINPAGLLGITGVEVCGDLQGRLDLARLNQLRERLLADPYAFRATSFYFNHVARKWWKEFGLIKQPLLQQIGRDMWNGFDVSGCLC